MKKQVILFTTRSITSVFNKSLVEQMAMLDQFNTDEYEIIFYTPTKSRKSAEYIEEVAGIRIDNTVRYGDDYKRKTLVMRTHDTWYDVYTDDDKHPELNNVSHIFMFGGILSANSGLDRITNKFETFLNNHNQMAFISVGQYVYGIFQLLNIAKRNNAQFFEFCYDTLENGLDQTPFAPLNYRRLHGYACRGRNTERCDSLQYYLMKYGDKNSLFEPEKVFDITFGMTVLTKRRERQYEEVVNALEGKDYKFFVKHKKKDINTFIPRDEYLEYIKQSRFTLIVPPYDTDVISVYRFIESIYNNCLPLITEDVKIDEFVKGFDLDKEAVNRIVVNYDSIKFMPEDEREELLEYFKEKVLYTTTGISF